MPVSEQYLPWTTGSALKVFLRSSHNNMSNLILANADSAGRELATVALREVLARKLR